MIQDVPTWAWTVLLFLIGGFLTFMGKLAGNLISHVMNKNEVDWKEMKSTIEESFKESNGNIDKVSENVNKLTTAVTLHEFRITQNAADIKDLQGKL